MTTRLRQIITSSLLAGLITVPLVDCTANSTSEPSAEPAAAEPHADADNAPAVVVKPADGAKKVWRVSYRN
jgi:hypothetical protein